MILSGAIQDCSNGFITVVAPIETPDIVERQCITDCEIRLDDGRKISNEQRRKIFALVNDIGEYTSRVSNQREYTETLRQLKLALSGDRDTRTL